MGVLGVGSIQHTGRFKSERGRGRMGGGEGGGGEQGSRDDLYVK